MAYQPKSYRKFLATSLSAVVAVSAAAPLAASAATTSFTDVPAGAWYAGSLANLVDAGIIGGVGNNKFNPTGEVTRTQLAKMLVYAAGLDENEAVADPGFSDVKTSDWFYKDVAVAAAHGLMNGMGNGTFGVDATLTRDQMATAIVNAFDLRGSVDTSSVNLPYTDLSGSAYTNDIKVLYGLGVLQNTTKYNPSTTVDRQTFVAFLDKTLTAVANLSPKVVSVSALNAKQVVVKFNTTLNSDSAVVGDASEASLYTLDGIQASNAVLSSDKKSVTLTFNGGVEGTDQVLVVNPVVTNAKDADGNWVKTEKFSQIFTYADTVKPTITSTSYANGKITLNFSEDLYSLPTVVRVNGVPVTAVAFATGSKSKVEVTTTLAAGSTASLYVAGAQDASTAKNEMNLYNGSVVAPGADTEKPRISSIEVTGQNTAKVTLSEAVTENPISATLQKGATQTAVTLVKDLTDTTGKTYTLTVDLNGTTAGDGIFSGTSTSETYTLYVAANAMTDGSGLKNDLYSTTLTFVKDTTPPVVTSSQVSSDNKKLEFTFSEDLATVGSASNIVITNGDGVRLPAVVSETGVKSGDAKTYQIDTKSGDVALDAGTYTVSIPAGFFKDSHGNASAAISGTFTVGAPSSSDTTKPTAVVTNTTGATDSFTVTYSEEMGSSALNLANYSLDGAALPAGTDIYFTNTNKNVVVIALPANSVNIGDQTTGASAILSVSGAADKAGNVINSANYTVTLKDNTPATVTNVQVIGQDVYVTFNEDVVVPATTDADLAFDVTENNVAVTAGDLASVAGNSKQVKFTLDSAPTATPVVNVKDAQTVLKDADGVAVQ